MIGEDFLWGAATSPHQVEGWNTASDMWLAETAEPPLLPEASGAACDSYNRWAEDLDLVSSLGLTAYRFGIEWARIEPEAGQIDQLALAHYRAVIDGCLARRITPVVTLHHFTNPAWFRTLGGWTADGAADLFARYVETVLPLLKRVRWVCTINEPNMIAMLSASLAAGELSTLVGLPEADPAVSEALATAHRRARDVLSSIPTIRSGWTVANQNAQPGPGVDASLVQDWSRSREDFFLEVARGDDFVGVQAYTRTVIGVDGHPVPVPEGTPTTQTEWEFYPPALGEAVRHTAAIVGPSTPILVTENGVATANDDERINYLEGALAGLSTATDEGIDVRGYIHWSLLDNFEWGSWAPTFGLVAVDRTTFQRTVKPSAHRLGEYARDRRGIR